MTVPRWIYRFRGFLVSPPLIFAFVWFRFEIENDRYEEAGLVKGYGLPYRKYMLKVPRWFPCDLYLRKLRLINEHFFSSIVAEIHCLLFLLPYILKEVF